MNSESIQLMKFVAVGEHFLCYFHTVVYYVEQWDRSESMFSVNKPYGSRLMLSFVIYQNSFSFVNLTRRTTVRLNKPQDLGSTSFKMKPVSQLLIGIVSKFESQVE